MNTKPHTLTDLLDRDIDAAYHFLDHPDGARGRLSFQDLRARSRDAAVRLAWQTTPGDRVLLCYPPGLEFVVAFFACQWAGVIPVLAPAPHPAWPERSRPRLVSIVRDCRPRLFLSTSATLRSTHELREGCDELRALPAVAMGDLDGPVPTNPTALPAHRRPSPDDLALLQYTSGSTARPRGVMVLQRNLLHNLEFIGRHERNDADSRSVSWLPVHHDMGLVEGVLQPLFGGYPAFLMSPLRFLQRPLRWLQAISDHRATNSGGPDFAYRLCVQRIAAIDRAGLDLSSWRAAYDGAEPVRMDTLRRFHQAFGPCGLRWKSLFPVYGLAEATLAVTSGTMEEEPRERTGPDGKARVSCGRSGLGTKLSIVDPRTRRPLGDHEEGEIWVRGPGVTAGYWGREAETRECFHAQHASGTERWLRTGDLGWMHGAELHVSGRLKDLLVLRGVKHHPEDIERGLEAVDPCLRTGGVAAVGFEEGGEEKLCVLAELHPRHRRADDNEVRHQAAIDGIRESVGTDHGVVVEEVLLLVPGALPRGSSGKLQRHRCRQHRAEDRLAVVRRWSRRQERPLPELSR